MMRPMLSTTPLIKWTRQLTWVLAATALAVGIGLPVGLAQSPVTPSPLIGEWILESSDRPGTPSGIGIRRKTFTQTTWSMVQKDPTTGIIVFQHGGEKPAERRRLRRNGAAAGPSTSNLIGQAFTYRVTVGDNSYSQMDGTWNETWKRAPREQ